MIIKRVLFISDGQYLDSAIKGGVQLCTHEYLQYISLAGYETILFKVLRRPSLITKLRMKFGIDVYEIYSIEKYLKDLIHLINSSKIKLVFFNQLSIAVWANELKKHVAADVKFVGLSHGNESADFLHYIKKNGKPTKLQTWRLGQLLLRESELFSILDGVIVLSEEDASINRWLGIDHTLYLPRILFPEFILWEPVKQAGFVGTLDHLPNRIGIELLARELQHHDFKHVLKLVGGPASAGQELASKYQFIQYLGPLSEDEFLNEVKTWSVFLNPVFWHSRGASTKLAMAIKLGIPCITTKAGKRGYSLSDETIVTPDNTPETFAKTVISVLSDYGQLEKLKEATESNAKNFDVAPWIIQFNFFLTNLQQS